MRTRPTVDRPTSRVSQVIYGADVVSIHTSDGAFRSYSRATGPALVTTSRLRLSRNTRRSVVQGFYTTYPGRQGTLEVHTSQT